MVMSKETFDALHVFKRERHPSAVKAGGSKEGFSLYGVMMGNCKSKKGVQRLKEWLWRPSRDVALLQRRHDALSFFTDPSNQGLVKEMQEAIRTAAFDVDVILRRIAVRSAADKDWQKIQTVCMAARTIRTACYPYADALELFYRISKIRTDDLAQLADQIHTTCDVEETASKGRFVVKPFADSELDGLKRRMRDIPAILDKVANEEIEKLDPSIHSISIKYEPRIGFQVQIPFECLNVPAGRDPEVPGHEYLYNTGQQPTPDSFYVFRSARTMELDDQIGDLHWLISDREALLGQEMERRVLALKDELLEAAEVFADLDCLLAMAMFARENNHVRPRLVTGKGIKIVKGRHPLQELVEQTFIANDTLLTAEGSLAWILTGANGSGKSMFLKQVALMVYMVQVGLFVPAESAEFGIVDRIFTRIQSRETATAGLSAFMMDLNQVTDAVHNATTNSLVIWDEFGKGTGKSDGMALLVAVIEEMVLRKEACPMLLVSTHFHDIMAQKMLPNTKVLSYHQMQSIINGDEMICLYQLVPSSKAATSSNARYVMIEAGFPDALVDRADEVTAHLLRGQYVYVVVCICVQRCLQ